MGKRIGLMLANLYQGSSISMWKAFAKAASRHKDGSFFVFPGGKLGEDNGDEYMRNDIFSLVTPESIDGVIIWTSALSGTRDASELRDYALGFMMTDVLHSSEVQRHIRALKPDSELIEMRLESMG